MGSPLFNAPCFPTLSFLIEHSYEGLPEISSVPEISKPQIGKEVLDSTEDLYRTPELGRFLRDGETVFSPDPTVSSGGKLGGDGCVGRGPGCQMPGRCV